MADTVSTKNLVIIGAGGLAREACELAEICMESDKSLRIKGFLSDGPSNIEALGYPPILGTTSDYSIEEGDVFFCAIGKVSDRKKTVERIKRKGGKFINLIHPSANISRRAHIGEGVAIRANCSISNECVIRDHCYLQGTVILGHDVELGKFCQINSFTFIAGNVSVGDLCTLNAGCRIIQGISIGKGSTVGMGSVVLRKVKQNVTVFGVPAREII